MSDRDNPSSRPLKITIESTAERSVLAQASASSAGGLGRYEFAVDLSAGFDASALLAGSVGVFAENAYALKGKLELERASELALIKEQPNPERVVLFDLSFAEGGTAESFLGTGWGRLEEAVCCTEGPHATLEVPTPSSPDERYELIIDCYAFLPAPYIENQRMTVTLNGFAEVVDVNRHDFGLISFTYPTRALAAADSIRIQFDLPNCFRPVDYKLNEDVRQLSFAFRKLTFSRLVF